MVYVGDKKYACETCIKGHRSSTCKHTDRPLFEIKKKGRPVTQCEHCRELRKTKQVHVKCMCATREDTAEGPSKRGGAKVPASAAFPGGLPEALEASVALHLASDGSDSEQSGHVSQSQCSCKESGSCNCWSARIARPKRKVKPHERRASTSESEAQLSQPAGLVVHAHAGDYRPVLPRPPEPDQQLSPSGHVHDPSASQNANASSSRHQPHHGQMFYSPYGRAYEYTHGSDLMEAARPSVFPGALSPMQVPPASHAATTAPMSNLPPWLPPVHVAGSESSLLTASLCGCGPSCSCPGCVEHRGQGAESNATCSNPNTCMSCLDCAMLSLPVSLAPESPRLAYDAPQVQNIDEWLRQVSNLVAPLTSQPLSPLDSQTPNQISSHAQLTPPSDAPFDPNMLQTYALWNEVNDGRARHAAPEECCGGRCKCPAGMCACVADCCGCCQGCQCANCEHGDQARTLTFATSGERAPCCSEGQRHRHSPVMAPVPLPAQSRFAGASPFAGTAVEWQNATDPWTMQSLSVPRTTLSRASSLSSHSSGGHSHITSSSLGSALQLPNPGDGLQAARSCCSSR